MRNNAALFVSCCDLCSRLKLFHELNLLDVSLIAQHKQLAKLIAQINGY